MRAALALLALGCSGDAAATSSDLASQDVQAALSLAVDGLDTKPESLLEAYRLVERHPPAETLPLLVDALGAYPRAAIHLLGRLPWDHPEPAFKPLRRLLVEDGPPVPRDPGGKGLERIVIRVDRGILRGETAMALASLGDVESYDAILEMAKKDPQPIARQQAAWALGELGRAEAIDPLKAIARTLASDEESQIQGFVIRTAIERLEFLRDHAGDDTETAAAARAVWRMAGWSEDQVKRLEASVSSLRALDPALRTKLLEAWSADERRPTIARASRWALKHLETR